MLTFVNSDIHSYTIWFFFTVKVLNYFISYILTKLMKTNPVLVEKIYFRTLWINL